jgi:gluconate kinase
LAILERPGPDERAIAFDIAKPIEDIAAQASAWLLAQE